MGVVDSVIAKYIATVVGFTVVSRPFLDLSHPRHLTSSHREIMEDYYRSGRMLVNMAGPTFSLLCCHFVFFSLYHFVSLSIT